MQSQSYIIPKQKATLSGKKLLCAGVAAVGGGGSLDKLAQLGKTSDGLPALRKRARRKYLGVALVSKLLTLNSELHKSYLQTLYCGATIVQRDGKQTSSYCNNRWCPVCGAIRTGKAINGYLPQLENLQDAYFVTLTAKNVVADDLESELDLFARTFKQIMEVMKKRGTPIIGLRKLEITHGRHDFNPHYHLIIENKAIAATIIDEWLKRMPHAEKVAQHATKADEGAMLELLKYSTKLTAKAADVSAMDCIFRALRGRRTLQPMGGLKRINDQVTELDATIETSDTTEAVYYWIDNDWWNVETGEGLTGYKPDSLTKEIADGYHIGGDPPAINLLKFPN